MATLPVRTPDHLVGRTQARRRAAHVAVALAVPTVVILLLAGPMIWDRGLLGVDWFSHLWYIWHQAESLRLNHHPSLFAYSPSAVFDPHYAYYGGTLYAFGGMLTLILGSPVAALDLGFVIGMAWAYAGWCWLAWMAGLRGAWVHASGLLFISSTYYLMTMYGGGGWPELMAVSSIPMLLASAWSVQRSSSLRLGPLCALALSTIVFTGSHNITLLWGLTVVGVVIAAITAGVPSARRAITWRGLRRVGLVVVPSVLVNAWFLVPTVVFGAGTTIANDHVFNDETMRLAAVFVTPRALTSLGRHVVDPEYPFYVFSLPMLALAWVVGSLVLSWPSRHTGWFRAVLVFLGIGLVLTVLLSSVTLLLALPSPWDIVQAGFRLTAYVELVLCGAVIAALALLALQTSVWRRRWRWLLVPVVVVSVVQGRQQVTAQPGSHVRDRIFRSATIPYRSNEPVVGSSDYAEARLTEYAPSADMAIVRFPTTAEHAGRVHGVYAALPGQIVRSNLVAAPSLVRVTGARIVGREASGTSFLQIDDDATPEAAAISVEPARPWPVVAGEILSLLGLVGLAGLLVTVVRAR